MSKRQAYTLATPNARLIAAQAVADAPDGYVCTVAPPGRSLSQNALLHKWFGEIARQRGDVEALAVKTECKGFFGVPMLCAEDDDFRAAYDAAIRPLPYEKKMRALVYWPVTSIMSVDQFSRFMDAVWQDSAEKGFRLTTPEDA